MRHSLSLGMATGILAIGMSTAPAFADIKVNEPLTLSGFIDMSTTATLPQSGPKNATATLDQFELDFFYKFSDALSARADLSNATVEQAFITYTDGSLALGAGKFLSASGWEAAEPTGMYQYSWSNANVYGAYQNGVYGSYAISPLISVYAAFVDDIWIPDGNLVRPGAEAQIALMPSQEITVKATNLFQQQPGYVENVVNVWASYISGPLTTAVEGDYLLNYDQDRTDAVSGEGNNGFGYLAMVNYKLTDAVAVTGRFSGLHTDAGNDNEVTVSPSYALASNWLVLAEAKYELDDEILALALETTVTF